MNAKEYLSIQSFLDEPPEESPYARTYKKLKGYADASYQSLKRGLTPAARNPHITPTQQTLKEIALEKSRRVGGASGLDSSPELQSLIGMGEVALTLGTGMYDAVRAPISAGLHGLFSPEGDPSRDVNKQMGSQTYSPRTAVGKNILDKISPFLNELSPLGPWGARAIVGLPSTIGNIKLKGQMGRALPEPMPTSNMGARVDAVKAKKTAEQFLKEEVPVRTEKGLTLEQVPEETRLAQENLNKAAQADMFVDEPLAVDHTAQLELPLTDDPVSGMAKRNIEASDQLDLFEHKQPDVPDLRAAQMEEMYAQRPQTDENVVLRQEQEQAKLLQEEQLQDLEDTLRAEQYSPTGSEQGPKTRAAKEAQVGNQRLNRFGQGGAIDSDLRTLGIPKLVSGIRRLVAKTPVEDTILTPTTQANIDAKALKRSKANAIGYKGSAYDQITTKEEALALAGKNIGPITQEAAAGLGGVVSRHPNNGILKYTLHNYNEANRGRDAYLKKYITGDNSFNSTYAKLNKQEKVDAFELKKKLSEDQVDYTPEYGEQLGLSEPLKQHMQARQAALDTMEAEWGKMNGEKGLETFEHRAGYLASIFDRNFQALVGKRMSDGSFKMETMIGAKSRREFNLAQKMYAGKDIIKLGDNGRTGLRQHTGKLRVTNDMAFLLDRMAEHDPRFAEAKQALSTAQAIRDKGYKNFDVHEMDKKGVTGYLGNKPWESMETNMKDALEAEIRYFDQAATYVHTQRLLDKTHEIVTEIEAKQPDTARYLNKWINNVTGETLHPIAGFVNNIVDTAVKVAGHGANLAHIKMPENPAGFMQASGAVTNALLMGTWNPTMAAVQMTQLYQAGIPEALKLRGMYHLDPHTVGTSMAKAHWYRTLLPLLDRAGMLEKASPPPHMLEAFQWIKKHGMDDFNEVVLSQDILQSKGMSRLKKAAFWPTVLPEKFTRPTMFMWMTDMFYEAGYRGDEMLNRAKVATDRVMTDYRKEETPLMYNKMGVLSTETSALQKYKHNALDQVLGRTKEAKQFPLAFLSAAGLSIAMGGLLGLPAMQEIDELIVKPVTKKSAREHLENAMGQGSSFADGLASAYSQLDLGSRFALSDTVPDNAGQAIAGARLTKQYKMVAAAYDFAKNQDEASLIALGKEVIPSGLSQAYQEQFMTDKEGSLLNKKGQVQYEHKRDTEGLSKSALAGVRPLAEKQESERVWAASQRMIKLEEELTHATERMKIANNIGDEKGFDKWLKTYEEKAGNMKNLGGVLKQSTEDAAKTEKERRQGKPGKTPLSIKRFLEFED